MTVDYAHLPGPTPLPLVGDLPALAPDPLGFLTGMCRRYGDAVRFRVGSQRTLLLSDPALIEQVLVGQRASTIKDPVTASLSDVLGNGLLTAEGETWKKNRRLVAPTFQPRHLAALAGTMVSCTEAHLSAITDGPRNVHVDMMELTLDIAVRTLFGTVLHDTARVGPLVEDLMICFDKRIHTWRRLLPRWVPTPMARLAARNKAELNTILRGIVQRRRDEGADGDDLLARLLAARDDDGRGMDDEQLADELLTLFLAGHETTALSLGYAQMLLAEHGEIQDRVHAELDEVLTDGPPTAADSRRLPLIDAVIQESMRLYPPAWVVGRQAIEEFVVGDIRVPRGTVILLPQWVVHRDPRWFDAPDTFRPDRWLEPSDRPKYAFFPFGGGPRVCVGNHFARMEAVLVLATLLQRVRLSTADGPALALRASVTLRPRDGIHLRVTRRSGRRAAA